MFGGLAASQDSRIGLHQREADAQSVGREDSNDERESVPLAFYFFFNVTPGPAREPSSLRVKVLVSPPALTLTLLPSTV